MFIHKFGDKELALLSRLAEEKGMDVDRLARLVFSKGFRLVRSSYPNIEDSNPSSWEEEQQKRSSLIREHWQTKSDVEIGKLLDPPLGRSGVHRLRLQLGLKRKRGTPIKKECRGIIDREEFERMITQEGYTMREYFREKNISWSTQRMGQLAEELGVRHAPQDRTFEWKLWRKARHLGNINLAKREWLEEQLLQAVSLQFLAASIGIDEYSLHFFVRSFGLTHPSIRKYGVMTVDLVCKKCGTPFPRLKRWVDRRIKNANGRELEFFCSNSCSGQYNKERAAERKECVTPT